MISEKIFFQRGVKIPKQKHFTKDLKISEITPPKYLYFPMNMHIGKSAQPVVKIGDKVKIGTLLGKIDGFISASIHASVSGTVIDITTDQSFRGKGNIVVVENDFRDDKCLLDPLPENFGIKEYIKRIEEAGITGKGGAGFPTHVKYGLDKDKADYLVINGAECEPYITTDYRIMIEYGKELIQISSIIGKLYDVKEIIFAIESHDSQVKNSLLSAIKSLHADNIKIHELAHKYPAGHADLQVREILGREKKYFEVTSDVGILQSNVSTLKAIYDAVIHNETLHSRVITINGPGIKEAKNISVPIGTTVEHIIEQCGGLSADNIIMINGGPMMGRPFDNVKTPVNKETNCLLFLPPKQLAAEGPCIRCARCVNHCPVGLQPILISNVYRSQQPDLADDLNVNACIRCGVCTYVCPAKINLLADINNLRNELEKKSR